MKIFQLWVKLKNSRFFRKLNDEKISQKIRKFDMFDVKTNQKLSSKSHDTKGEV